MKACLNILKVCLLNFPSLTGSDSQASNQYTILDKKVNRSSLTVNGRQEESFKRTCLYGTLTLNILHKESIMLTKLEVFVLNATQRWSF